MKMSVVIFAVALPNLTSYSSHKTYYLGFVLELGGNGFGGGKERGGRLVINIFFVLRMLFKEEKFLGNRSSPPNSSPNSFFKFPQIE
jgi:hypothetical protein